MENIKWSESFAWIIHIVRSPSGAKKLQEEYFKSKYEDCNSMLPFDHVYPPVYLQETIIAQSVLLLDVIITHFIMLPH